MDLVRYIGARRKLLHIDNPYFETNEGAYMRHWNMLCWYVLHASDLSKRGIPLTLTREEVETMFETIMGARKFLKDKLENSIEAELERGHCSEAASYLSRVQERSKQYSWGRYLPVPLDKWHGKT